MLTLFSCVEEDLKNLESKLIDYLKTQNQPTNQILETIFSSGGKRIRPSLFLLCAQILNYEGEFKFPIAAVCEFIHTASLLHDDVIDNSTLRRNKPTVNSVWGDETAVLSGDLIYSTACRLMVRTRHLDLIDCFAECIRAMSESELFQLEMLWNKNTTVDDYFKIVQGKTANLFEASCLTPAYLNKSDTKICLNLSEFGKNLGFAFQIFDDCLDFDGDENIVGKPVASDFVEGKLTLPLLYALEKNDDELNLLVNKAFETSNLAIEDKLRFISRVKELGGLKMALNKAEEFAKSARNSLDELDQILKLSHSETTKIAFNALRNMTFFVLKRKN